jgi:hypothetical protein
VKPAAAEFTASSTLAKLLLRAVTLVDAPVMLSTALSNALIASAAPLTADRKSPHEEIAAVALPAFLKVLSNCDRISSK